jgi:hypothetical protein
MLQLEERGPLLLEGLVLVFMRDADLHQLPVAARDLLLPRLEHGLRLLKRGTLPLELAQCLLARHPLLFERGPGVDERRPLPLELAFRLLAGSSLLPELLLRRGERGGLVRRGFLQSLRLLERRTTLLELGAGVDDLRLQ